MSEPYLANRQQIAMKIESTEGTDAVNADADVLAPVEGLEWAPNFELNDRGDTVQNSHSQLSAIVGEQSATVSFSTEIKGEGNAGVVPPNLSVALRACGFSETIVAVTSVTYAPVSEDYESATIEIREVSNDGTAKIKKILGARGTVTFEAEKGGLVRANFEFTGKYVEPTEGAAFTQPSPGTVPVAFQGVQFSLHGVGSLRIQSLEIDMANEVNPRNDVNDSTGNTSGIITGRAPTGTINPEQEDIATINFFNKVTTNAEGSMSFVLGTSAGNITTFTMPKTQITDSQDGDRDTIRTEELALRFNQDTDAGDDEISIVFT